MCAAFLLILREVWACRAAVIPCVLPLVVFLVTVQIQDMMGALADSPFEAFKFHVSWGLLALGGWFWSRATLAARLGINERGDGWLVLAPFQQTLFQWLPRAVFAVAAMIGVVASLRSTVPLEHLAIAAGVGGVGILLLWQRLRIQDFCGIGRGAAVSAMGGGWFRRHAVKPILDLVAFAPFANLVAGALLGVATALMLLGALDAFGILPGIVLRDHLPPLLVSAVFPGAGAALFAFLVAIPPFAALVAMSDSFTLTTCRARWHIPFDIIVLALSLLGPDIARLHDVRVVQGDGVLVPRDRPTLTRFVQRWRETCLPAANPHAPLHPVIVAASGGAARAGLWAARILREIEAASGPNAAIVAVSSVSGGSLGTAAWFSALEPLPGRSDGACAAWTGGTTGSRAGWLDAAMVGLGGDALGPGVAGYLLLDLPRAVFAPVVALVGALGVKVNLRGNDRAEAIERGLDRLWRDGLASWTESAVPRDFEAPFLSLFLSRDQTGSAVPRGSPLWIANSTDVQTGARVLHVPFAMKQGLFRDSRDALSLTGADLFVATVLNNTARFPVLEPTGSLASVVTPPVADRHHGEQPTRVIDGGYFDNSGLVSAFELAQWLQAHAALALPGFTVEPVIVEVTSDADDSVAAQDVPRCGWTPPRDDPGVSLQGAGADEVSAPLVGVLATRPAHEAWFERFVVDVYCHPDRHFFHFYLHKPALFDIPLNWVLSEKVRSYIWNAALDEADIVDEKARLRRVLAE